MAVLNKFLVAVLAFFIIHVQFECVCVEEDVQDRAAILMERILRLKTRHISYCFPFPDGCNPMNGELKERMDDPADSCADCMSKKPVDPLPSGCYDSGCEPCGVYDLYKADITARKKTCYYRDQGGQQIDKIGNTNSIIKTNTYKSFELLCIKKISPNSVCYRFSIPNMGSLNLGVAQNLVLRADVDGHHITRKYTPVNPLRARGYFDVAIKLYDDSAMSNRIGQWKVGDMVDWRGPYGRYQYQQNKFSFILMIAAGTGITPLLQVIRQTICNQEDSTSVRLLYACRTYQDILFRKELNELSGYWNFNVIYVLSRENQSCTSLFGEDIRFGRITEQLIEQEIPSKRTTTQVLICGTKSFDKDMIKYLKKLNFDGDIFKF